MSHLPTPHRLAPVRRRPFARGALAAAAVTGIAAALLSGAPAIAAPAAAAVSAQAGVLSGGFAYDQGAWRVWSSSDLNTSGGTNSVALTATGSTYVELTATFPGIGGPGIATADAETYGFGDWGMCNPTAWWVSPGGGEQVRLRCSPRGMDFHVTFTRAVSPSGSYAYALAARPSTGSYSPGTQFSTSSGKLTVTRLGVGSYRVRIPHMQTARSTVSISTVASLDRVCRVRSWAPVSGQAYSDQLVRVDCQRTFGALADTKFAVVYAAGQNILGLNDLSAGWVFANRPYVSTYTPPQWWSDGSSPITIENLNAYNPGGYWLGYNPMIVNCYAGPSRGVPAAFLLQYSGGFYHLTQYGTTHNVCHAAID